MTPATVGTGTTPHAVTVDPTGRYAYVANSGDNNVSQYTIGAGGALNVMTPATVGAGATPYSAATTD
jgi:DNA-binding beta-propeller fold protein YncE